MLAALYDAIDRYNYSFEREQSIHTATRTIDYYFDEISLTDLNIVLNDDSVVSKEIVNTYDHCSDCGGRTNTCLKVVYNLSDDEKLAELEHTLVYRKSAENFIIKCLERNPDQLESFKRVTNNMENFKNFKINT